ncbi:GATA zinc finger domain-containing protein 4-like isoform X1 [Vespula squamosa]|uniref:GATA zinc finger domain-containing protein 4-like isoform X1 n=1 Tax=Vespula squamosa TaxID=30214 RepID=A0ABD2BDH7_VESSQ
MLERTKLFNNWLENYRTIKSYKHYVDMKELINRNEPDLLTEDNNSYREADYSKRRNIYTNKIQKSKNKIYNNKRIIISISKQIRTIESEISFTDFRQNKSEQKKVKFHPLIHTRLG